MGEIRKKATKKDIRETATRIKSAYDDLKKDDIYKEYRVQWNNHIGSGIPEITVINDAGFRAILIGDVRNAKDSRGYMYLFYTNDENVKFPSITEITRRLQIIANEEVLEGDTVAYYDWPEYGSLKKQRKYFAEIVNRRYAA